jgi:hypothetical protein
MDNAFEQRENIHQDSIQSNQTVCYRGDMKTTDKITLVWERRLGKNQKNEEIAFTSMKLSLYDQSGKILIDQDHSKIDNVLQVSAFPHELRNGLVKIKSGLVEGAQSELFVLVSGSKMEKAACS